MSSHTPRTDAAPKYTTSHRDEYGKTHFGSEWVDSQFAKQLEEELSKWKISSNAWQKSCEDLTERLREKITISTPCPACGNATLLIRDKGLLSCDWVSCPDPTFINRIGEVFPDKWEQCQRESQALRSELAALKANQEGRI